MSLNSHQELECPKCGRMQTTLVWQSLNVTIDPEEKQNLFEGKINVLECSGCGNKAFVNAPFGYHDMRLQFYVQYIPFECLEDEGVLQGYHFKADGFPGIQGGEAMNIPSDSYFRRQHIVFDMGELVRYVVFRERLSVMLRGKGEQDGAGNG